MSSEGLLALALQAIDDADARPVLSDAIEETGWWDERLGEKRWATASVFTGGTVMGIRCMSVPEVMRFSRTSRLRERKARAIAAVLLFGSWPTSWPLAERCRRRFQSVRPALGREVTEDRLFRVLEDALDCPDDQTQIITRDTERGLYDDDFSVLVERWPHGARNFQRVAIRITISRMTLVTANNPVDVLLYEARRADRALRDHFLAASQRHGNEP